MYDFNMEVTSLQNNTSYVSGDELYGDYDYDYYNIESRQSQLLQAHALIAIVFGTISLLLNLVILLALYQVRNRITTHYQLIISLAVSDMVVASSVLLHYINKVYNPLYHPDMGSEYQRIRSMCTFLVIKALNSTGLNITLLNLMLMALDHYLAIMKPLHYPVICNKGKLILIILAMWLLAFILGFSDFASALAQYQKFSGYNYCEVVRITPYQDEYTVFAIAPVCLGIMIYMYTRICLKVWKRNTPGSQSIRTQGERGRSTKALVTTLLHIGTFVISWLPVCLFEISLLFKGRSDPQSLYDNQSTYLLINNHLYNLMIMNAIADPIIYTVRMREVRIGFSRLFPCWICDKCMPTGELFSTSVISRNNEMRHTMLQLRPLENVCSRQSTAAHLNDNLYLMEERTDNAVVIHKEIIHHTDLLSIADDRAVS